LGGCGRPGGADPGVPHPGWPYGAAAPGGGVDDGVRAHAEKETVSPWWQASGADNEACSTPRTSGADEAGAVGTGWAFVENER